jgi:hypothetical protein
MHFEMDNVTIRSFSYLKSREVIRFGDVFLFFYNQPIPTLDIKWENVNILDLAIDTVGFMTLQTLSFTSFIDPQIL